MRMYRLNCLMDEFLKKKGNHNVTGIVIDDKKGLLEIRYEDVNEQNKAKKWQKPFRVGAN